MASRKLRLSAVVCALLVFHLDAGAAFAQERRTLFDFLFGGNRASQREEGYERQREQRIIREPRQRNRPTTGRVVPAPAAPTTAAKPEPAQKFDNARRVLVIGDFTAMSLGSGLEDAFAPDPSIVISEHGESASGLVRQDHLEWPRELAKLLASEKPALVIVMLGANDRQQMQLGENREKFRSEKWMAEYEQRVGELAKLVTDQKLPLLWVGLPAFQSPALTADALTLNGIYRDQVEKVGGEFVDVWDGFVDEGGEFVMTGSDVNGQPVRLRGQDGVSFTTAGKRKLAFYAEKFIRRHLGDLSVGNLIRLDSGNLPLLSAVPPENKAKVVSQPVALTDPDLDGGKDLLGGQDSAVPSPDSPRNMLLTKGVLPSPPVGRVDYYQTEVTGSTQ
ncbi:SGNH/GDSL hydrolase family protein [Rhizobium oryzicola]|uniref:DUF459 domain-containing protein n=1 Tax=Rhizobium oryzicola TaxID=1232668 RepID=A0ABT8SUK8_9HYPH|nr:DUF459 domain-containing protein [Rhizobium oryzicola]MDO1581975.1 DUF459 domain-containing protein [Rhizobium oryzicola]